MIILLTLLVAILCAYVGFLLAKVESQRDEIDGPSGDIRDLWAAVFGGDEDDPDPGAEEDECRAIVQRIRGGDPWSQDAIHQRILQSAGTAMSQQQGTLYAYQRQQAVQGFGVDRCEWWGSKDGKLEIWPKPDDYDARLSAAMAVLATVERTNGAIGKAAA